MLKVSLSIHCSRGHISPLGKVCLYVMVVSLLSMQLSRSFLGKGFWLRRIYALQEIDECPALWFESNPKSSVHSMVESNYQSSQCIRWFPGPAGLDGHFHVRISFYQCHTYSQFFRHGKIPTLKISLIQIFRAHLWQKSELVTTP